MSTRSLPPRQAIAELVGLILGGAYGGLLPDRFEPACQPCHRHFAHSVAAGTAIVCVLTRLGPHARGALRGLGDDLLRLQDDHAEGSWEWCGIGALSITAYALAGFVVGVPVGYISHLGLDHVQSKRGIPLLA